MGKIKADTLATSLSRTLKPLYLISGDETLLVSESCATIRKAAKSQGFSQHEIYHAEGQFNWDNLLHSVNSLSLFAEKKLIEVRIPNGKVGDAGSKALKAYCASAPNDVILILILPKLDKKAESSAWYKEVHRVGDCITIWPINAQALPRWVETRMRKSGLSADSDAISILCAKVEGNLLAAVQEIEKLKLLNDQNKIIDAALMAESVMDSSRYNVFDLIDKALSGDPRSTVNCLSGLKSEGTSAAVLLWALSQQVRSLLQVQELMRSGRSFDNAANQAKVWKSKIGLVQKAQRRLSIPQLQGMLRKCALSDKMIKGSVKGDEWNELLDVALRLAGVEALNKRSQKMALTSAR